MEAFCTDDGRTPCVTTAHLEGQATSSVVSLVQVMSSSAVVPRKQARSSVVSPSSWFSVVNSTLDTRHTPRDDVVGVVEDETTT